MAGWNTPLGDDTPPGDQRVEFTTRLEPVLHEELGQVVRATGRSMNALINEAVRFAMTSPGGSALIDRARRRLTVQGDHGEQAQAAVAYLASYLGQPGTAAVWWPWTQRFPGTGTADDLVLAGAWTACEIDRWHDGGAAVIERTPPLPSQSVR